MAVFRGECFRETPPMPRAATTVKATMTMNSADRRGELPRAASTAATPTAEGGCETPWPSSLTADDDDGGGRRT